MTFDPQKIKSTKNSTGPKRVHVEVLEYLTPDDDFHSVLGADIHNKDKIYNIRMTTVSERMNDLPKQNKERVQSQYEVGDNTRDSIQEKMSKGVRVIAFDDVRETGAEKDGVIQARAHWGTTVSKDDAQVIYRLASLRLVQATEQYKSKGYVETIDQQILVDGKNIISSLEEAMGDKDAEGNNREPYVIFKLKHKGNTLLKPRLYSETETAKRFDQESGEEIEYQKRVSADKTIIAVIDGSPADPEAKAARKDTVRAIISGLKGDEVPTFYNQENKESNEHIYKGIKDGDLEVEMIKGEIMRLGPKTKQTYLKNEKMYANAFNVSKNDSHASGYTDTVIGFKRHENDGTPYVTYVGTKEMFAKPVTLDSLKQTGESKAERKALSK